MVEDNFETDSVKAENEAREIYEKSKNIFLDLFSGVSTSTLELASQMVPGIKKEKALFSKKIIDKQEREEFLKTIKQEDPKFYRAISNQRYLKTNLMRLLRSQDGQSFKENWAKDEVEKYEKRANMWIAAGKRIMKKITGEITKKALLTEIEKEAKGNFVGFNAVMKNQEVKENLAEYLVGAERTKVLRDNFCENNVEKTITFQEADKKQKRFDESREEYPLTPQV